MRQTISVPKAIVREGRVELTWLKTTPGFVARSAGGYQRFRVYRREEADFVFGEDYEEFFSGATVYGAETIFDGAIEASNDRKFAFVDAGVRIGTTYSYWVREGEGQAVGPSPVRVRDPEVWWSAERLARELKALRDAAPELVDVDVCGSTAMSVEIPVVRVGRRDRRIGLVGTVHGGESGPELIVPALQRLVREAPEMLERVGVVAVPSLNIDSRQAEATGTPWYIRTNGQGVDLNRNFPAQWETVDYSYGLDSSAAGSLTYRGPHAASAPESRAAMAALDGEGLEAVFSYHCLASICGLPALGPKAAEGSGEYAARCARLIEAFRAGMHPEAGCEGVALKFGTTAGSLPTWLFESAGVPAFDLEGGLDKAALEKCRYDHTDRALIDEYRERHYRGVRAVLETIPG